MSSNLLLLDTHIWIWATNGESERLSPECLAALGEESQRNLGISAISVWEVGMLETKGRIRFSQTCLDWVRAALAAPRVRLVQLSPEIAVESSRLPGEIHGDPADRILASTARLLGATLITQDKKLLDYGKQGFISVLPG